MDQDIHFQHKTALVNNGETTTYLQLPYDCTVRKLRGIIQGTNGSEETVTMTSEATVGGTSTNIGVLTFAAGSAGGVGTWVADSTDGETALDEDAFLKFLVTTAGTDDADIHLDIELDPYSRVA